MIYTYALLVGHSQDKCMQIYNFTLVHGVLGNSKLKVPTEHDQDRQMISTEVEDK